MNSEAQVRRYFKDRFGLELNDRQARTYRNIIGDLEGFIDFVSRKLGLLDGADDGLDVVWAQRVLSQKAYPSLASSDPEAHKRCSAALDFKGMVLDPLGAGRKQEAYEGVVAWLAECVAFSGYTTLRGAMARRSKAMMAEHGIRPPRTGSKKRLTKLEFLTASADDTIALVLDRLRGTKSQQFAARVGRGSLRYNEITSKLDGRLGIDVERAFEAAMLESAERLEGLEQHDIVKVLEDWLKAWSTDDGITYLRSALVSRRQLDNRPGDIVPVSRGDREFLEAVRDRHGYTNLTAAISHVVRIAKKEEGAQ